MSTGNNKIESHSSDSFEDNNIMLISKSDKSSQVKSVELKTCKPENFNTLYTPKRNTSKYYLKEVISTANADELQLRKRKLWSRWGKWGACSVTCGEGIISRRRLCVSGRCAPGELEEQRRPCFRQPCFALLEVNDDH